MEAEDEREQLASPAAAGKQGGSEGEQQRSGKAASRSGSERSAGSDGEGEDQRKRVEREARQKALESLGK